MCGIVGITGSRAALPVLLRGLQKLEYRGYDSAGVYVNDSATNDEFFFKEKGRVEQLEALVADKGIHGNTGIAHTRWATHGIPSAHNSHPHVSASGRFFLVHNGVIEGFRELKETYLQGVDFKSETDTEVAVQLVAKFVEQDGLTVPTAFRKVLALIGTGSYGFVLVDNQNPDVLYVARNKSPLLLGLGEDFTVVTSDAAAMLEYTHEFMALDDGEMAIIKGTDIEILNAANEPVKHDAFTIEIDAAETDKGIYPYYMLKEIEEQPNVIRTLLNEYMDDTSHVNIDDAIINELKQADRIYIVAAGTSYHASLIGKRMFEKIANRPTQVEIASEFAYDSYIPEANPFFIFLSQSGETADSREVLQMVEAKGFKSLTLTNVPNSTLAREATYALPLLAGPEIAVASTKAYTAQITVLAFLAQAMVDNKVSVAHPLAAIAVAMEAILQDKDRYKVLAEEYLVDSSSAFYIGRANDAELALEAALKLKEISYVHTEGFAAGELKHGTLALIEDNTPVIGLITQPKTAELTRSNLAETQARGAHTLIIATEEIAHSDDQVILPSVDSANDDAVVVDQLAILLATIPVQLLSYFTSLGRGLDVDRPRNLAKSVTVQ
ncbi:glutamine--fructose-6-phosphate transaminase (isomerizing) [Periweissella fabaria]|uniref:Glutamine--fructose-6-phosphate aminotransferase [isomerizing] n=1 Tax=Periweissella fabaria TaxID=546157 RepID=A0ABM8Z7P8_9LACO|nr:glutamine--fructose-6-phosphate transaminase (isomerizing) [Periweissella fabaria]MCM0597960.1 glutamine--fructose-6-phosphate transaminase (isomerizing) [Periweissella fabaria]CAH0417439.1 Glutamine--fructose-6-phosphate aminotransferase [isomerizing] [Periweissella fabaria]